jgi:hypothetical protein
VFVVSVSDSIAVRNERSKVEQRRRRRRRRRR